MSKISPEQALQQDYWWSAPLPNEPSDAVAMPMADTFRLLADNLPVLSWIAEADGSVAWYNRRWFDYCGTTPARMEGWGWVAVHDPSLLPSVVERWATSIALGQSFEMTYPLLGADRRFRPFLSRVVPVRNQSGQIVNWLGVCTDISEQENAKPHRSKSTMRDITVSEGHTAVLGQLGEGVVITDQKGHITFVNEAAARIHGVKQLGVSLESYSHAYHLFTEEGHPYPASELPLARAVLRGETVTEERWRIRRPDGSEVLAVGSARPVLTFEGDQVGAVLTLRDETARCAAEQAFHESEGRLRALADNLPSGMVYQVAMQRDGSARRFVYVSGSCERLTGIPAEVALEDPTSLYGIIEAEDLSSVISAERVAVQGLVPFDLEVRFVRVGDHEVRWCRLTSAPREMEDGSLIWDGLLVEITQQRRAEEALRKSEALKGAVVEGALDCVVTVDHEGLVLDWNPAAERTFGHSREAALGGQLAELIVPPRSREAHRHGFQRYLRTGEGTLVGRRIEVEAMRADGTTFPSELAITATLIGGRMLLTAYLRDITERRKAERQQALLVAELNHRVKNVLATVQAVADQTLRGTGGDSTWFAKPFLGRLKALARAHDLLTDHGWDSTEAGMVVRAALLPWLAEGGGDGRVSLSNEHGEVALISPRQAQALVLGLHELVTNAVKYGALSRPEGQVDVHRDGGCDGALRLVWQETGGPLVVAPLQRGFGTRLLQRGLAQELGPDASVELHFDPSGLRATICFVPAGA